MSITQIASPQAAAPAPLQPVRSAPAPAPSGEPASSTPRTEVPAASTVTLDPGTGRVVQEYFDATGALTSSIPSRQQLDAYRLADLAGKTRP